MDTDRFFVEKLRFHLKKEETLVFVGWFYDGKAEGHQLIAELDGERLLVDVSVNRGVEVRQKYIGCAREIDEEVVGQITLPAAWREHKRLAISSVRDGARASRTSFRVSRLSRLASEVEYYIENCHRDGDLVTVTGWCMADGDSKVELLGEDRQPVTEKVEHYRRRDLLPVFPECDEGARPGFKVQAKCPKGRPAYLMMRNAEKVVCVRLRKWDGGSVPQRVAEKAVDAWRYLRRNGLAATLRKIRGKLRKNNGESYEAYLGKYAVTAEELEAQREKPPAYQGVFSIVVPAYGTRPEHLRALLDSVMAQTCPNWQLCIALGRSDDEKRQAAILEILEEYSRKDKRICYAALEENLGISGNTNEALSLARGDYIVFADHDDVISPDAIYSFAEEVAKDPSIDMLYSDEDKVDMAGRRFFEPHFKPDYSIDLLCSVNYICHLLAVKRGLLAAAGGLRKEYDGAQDYDLILRCAELAKNIRHVPKVLYHWRSHAESTAANPESKRYAFEAGRRAIEAHYERLSIPARVEDGPFYGTYRTVYEWGDEPLVSVLIPNKDHAADLGRCLSSLLDKSDYPNLEVIVIENNSEEPGTFAYYDRLRAERPNVRVVKYEGGFNFSKINNFGARHARGEYLLLLNNDTEFIDGGTVREMMGYGMRGDVGAVGAKLLYEDGTIQHAGVVLGFGGTAGHAFLGKRRDDPGYFGRICCAQDYSAVTAACMLTRRDVFDAVGGFTEEFAVAFNDVDYCLKVRALGKLVVYDPYAELYHFESKSRGYEDSPEKVERFNEETALLISRWRGVIEAGDPYYNPNLTLDASDFSLRR